jgi:hypothetical protein
MDTPVKALVVLLAFATSGCATIISGGGKQQVTFNSEPMEATVTVGGKVVGRTPVTIQVDRAKNVPLVIEKEGYKPYNVQLSTSFNGWFFGNILIGGLLGSTTDGVSGAIHEFSPNQYYVTLAPDKPFEMESNRPRDVKEFVVASGHEIRTQLANGAGEHVDALLKLLGVADEGKATAVEAVKKMAAATNDDLELAKKLVDLYEVK